MSAGLFHPPTPVNEPVRNYAPGSPERASLKTRLDQLASAQIEVPMVIGGREVRTGDTAQAVMPHNHQHVLATYHQGGEAEVGQAIKAAADARREWSELPWEARAAVFLRAAELLTGPWRDTAERGHHAGPVQDRVPGRDRRSLRAGRLLALQRLLHCTG